LLALHIPGLLPRPPEAASPGLELGIYSLWVSNDAYGGWVGTYSTGVACIPSAKQHPFLVEVFVFLTPGQTNYKTHQKPNHMGMYLPIFCYYNKIPDTGYLQRK
jgi:hypothetical protein